MATLLLAVPIFIVLYQGVGLLLESRRRKVSGWNEPQPDRSQALRDMAASVGKLGFNRILLANKGYREKLDLLLMRSGYIFGWKPEDLLFFKELAVLTTAFLLWYDGVSNFLIWMGGLYVAFILPDFYVKTKGESRRLAVQRALPGFVDLAALALESGLDLLAAVERIVAKMKPSALREELQMLIQENRLGTPRKEGLQRLAFRTNLPDLQALTAIIIQSEELGTSLAMVLRNYAEDMRSRRLLKAEEIAGKAPVKLLFPMMVFFFPIIFVIIFGPLALNLLSSTTR